MPVIQWERLFAVLKLKKEYARAPLPLHAQVAELQNFYRKESCERTVLAVLSPSCPSKTPTYFQILLAEAVVEQQRLL